MNLIIMPKPNPPKRPVLNLKILLLSLNFINWVNPSINAGNNNNRAQINK